MFFSFLRSSVALAAPPPGAGEAAVVAIAVEVIAGGGGVAPCVTACADTEGSERTVLVVSAAGVALLQPVRAKTMANRSNERFGDMPHLTHEAPVRSRHVWCITDVGWDPYDEP